MIARENAIVGLGSWARRSPRISWPKTILMSPNQM